MPTVSRFYGIEIGMFYNDHAPPHFHVKYAEFEAEIVIGTLETKDGWIPRRATAGGRVGCSAPGRVDG
jgi:hypothetical protein